MYTWEIGTVNQLFVRGSSTQINFSKKRSQCQKSILCDRPILYSPLICTSPLHFVLPIDFWRNSFVWKCCTFIRSTLN